MPNRVSRRISALAALALLPGLFAPAQAVSVPAGSGTAADPFRITSVDELAILDDLTGAHYKLMNDLTLPASWEPLCNRSVGYARREDVTITEADFTGVLDGNGYTIDLRAVDASDQTLIYTNFGTIKNLRLVGGYSTTGDYYEDWGEGLATENNYGLVEACSAETDIRLTTSGSYAVGSMAIGGLVGSNLGGGTVKDCYGLADIAVTKQDGSGSGAALGAVVGENCYGTIINCYGVGTAYSTYRGQTNLSGGVCGYERKDSSSSGCYYDRDVLGHDAPGEGSRQFGKSTTVMKMQVNYSGWDFNNTWYLNASMNGGYPVLRCDKRFAIPDGPSTPADPVDPSGSFDPGPSTGVIRVFVNGQQLSFDQNPTAISGRTLVPVRAIFEALGAEVIWDAASPTVVRAHRASDNTTVLLELGYNYMAKQVNGGEIQLIQLDVGPVAMNNRTLVPVRAVSEAFDCQLLWDQDSYAVIITG